MYVYVNVGYRLLYYQSRYHSKLIPIPIGTFQLVHSNRYWITFKRGITARTMDFNVPEGTAYAM